MTQKTLKHYYQKAKKEGWALPQFNFSSAEQLQGIVQACVQQKAPLLLGTSEGDSDFLGKTQAVLLVESYRKDTKLPIFLNFDHGKSIESIRAAIEAGYDAVHFDGSHLSFAENIAQTKKIVALARKNRISVVEGEFQEVPGKHSIMHKGKGEADPLGLTFPTEAALFAEKTGVDSLAVMIGTVHGIYEKGNPRLDLNRLQEIKKHVRCFLVVHGGSGTPKRDLLQAVKTGVVKVNVSTELRVAFINTLRKTLKENPEEVAPYKLFPPSVEEVLKVAVGYLGFLGSSNKI
jgi:ketose-bisphosphate aldolase